MRSTVPVPLAVTVLAAALALTACDSKSSDDAKHSEKSAPPAAGCPIALKVGPANAATTAGDTGNVPVTLTNRSGGKCTFQGFPGVELNAGSSSWSVADDKAATPEKVTLQKGEAATFTLTYVRGKSGGSQSAAVKALKITVPGAGPAQSYPWSYGEVSLKSAGTPDASVSPIQVAGD
ncbi:hypothetical protein AAW14_26565 [Streptomyces hygroscopicus]|uniref:DUF4232 domain-containing protein n=1 Tax=Streptomyces hygroscopicus TaxID=1912 RepID=UPI00223F9E78|nr:DUF4232 domain-containing protein [Streptomyces hygroscopicus]MCW7945474.1 hypothetical protein [Streptomyces hygroscopicus]